DLLLADAHQPVLPAHGPRRQLVAQPAGRDPQHVHVVRAQPGLLPQLAVHGLERGLVAVHPALRELPAVAPHPAGPEDAAVGVHQHDAHVGAVAVRIDHDADSNGSTLPRVTATDSATGGTERQAGAPPRLTEPRTAWKIAGSPQRLCSSAG